MTTSLVNALLSAYCPYPSWEEYRKSCDSEEKKKEFIKNLNEYVFKTNEIYHKDLENFAFGLQKEQMDLMIIDKKDVSKRSKEKALMEEGERINASFLK